MYKLISALASKVESRANKLKLWATNREIPTIEAVIPEAEGFNIHGDIKIYKCRSTPETEYLIPGDMEIYECSGAIPKLKIDGLIIPMGQKHYRG
tara:strand:+ start:1152 stop:1436 length:285 start_codon:yes stop_codon:yes gene_type:complete